MCGRYTLTNATIKINSTSTPSWISDLNAFIANSTSYNISPMQNLPVLIHDNNQKKIENMLWSFIPPWQNKKGGKYTTFNARAENLKTSKLFCHSFKTKRCLVPASGYFEWNGKQPYYFHQKNKDMLFFAGVYSVFKNENCIEESSFAIITCEPNSLTKPIHNRMPAILSIKDFDAWLTAENQDITSLQKLLQPYPANEMNVYPVSKFVGSVKNNSPECIEPYNEELLF